MAPSMKFGVRSGFKHQLHRSQTVRSGQLTLCAVTFSFVPLGCQFLPEELMQAMHCLGSADKTRDTKGFGME